MAQLFPHPSVLGPQHMRSALTCVLEEPCGGDAGVHQHQHIPTDLLEQAVRSMHFRDLVAIDLQAHYHMRATLGQQDTADLRISPRPVLVAAARHRASALAGVSAVLKSVPSMAMSR